MYEWNFDFSHQDTLRKFQPPLARASDDFLTRCISEESRADGNRGLLAYAMSIADYLWMRLGRPRWFISKEMFDLLASTSIDADLTNVALPFDVMSFVFEKGLVCEGRPVRWTRVFFGPNSELAQNIIHEVEPNWKEEHLASALRENGKWITQTQCGIAPDPRIPDICPPEWRLPSVRICSVNGSEQLEDASTNTPPDFKAVLSMLKTVDRVVRAAILYWNARPELIVPFLLPRSERYKQIGNRDNTHRVKLPTEKIVREHSNAASTGTTVAPHYRGFVLRTLRHEKYRRNPDGTFRTVLVPPCAIHPELMESENGAH